MIRFNFFSQFIEIEEVPAHHFDITIRVEGFESHDDFICFLWEKFYRPPLPIFDSSSSTTTSFSSIAMSDSASDSSSSSGVREIVEKEMVASGDEMELSSRPTPKSSKRARARKNRTGVDPVDEEPVPSWAKKMGINLEDCRVRVVNDPIDCKALRVRKDAITIYRAHFEVGL